MEQKREIYKNKKNFYYNQIEFLKKDALSEKNKEILRSYQTHIFATGSGKYRVGKITSQLRMACKYLKEIGIETDLENLTRKELEALISYINKEKPLADATKADYFSIIKTFFLWLKKEDHRIYSPVESIKIERIKFYDFVEHDIKTSYKKPQIDPKTIITEEDISLVIEKGCTTIKQKALISLLHETGARAGEFLNMRIGDFKFLDTHAEVNVDGKTGKRTIQFVKSIPLVKQYLEQHQNKNTADAIFWLNDSTRNKNKPIDYDCLCNIIWNCFRKANCKKRHNPHWFRHSRASLLAPKLNQQMLCLYMGWQQGTRQIRTYAHLTTEQLEEAYLKANGIKRDNVIETEPIQCICKTINQATERYCHSCHRPLSVHVVMQDKAMVDSEIGKTMQFFMEIAKNPEMMKAFEKFKETFKQ